MLMLVTTHHFVSTFVICMYYLCVCVCVCLRAVFLVKCSVYNLETCVVDFEGKLIGECINLSVFERLFVKRFVICYRTVVCPVLSVCNVGALRPNG